MSSTSMEASGLKHELTESSRTELEVDEETSPRLVAVVGCETPLQKSKLQKKREQKQTQNNFPQDNKRSSSSHQIALYKPGYNQELSFEMVNNNDETLQCLSLGNMPLRERQIVKERRKKQLKIVEEEQFKEVIRDAIFSHDKKIASLESENDELRKENERVKSENKELKLMKKNSNEERGILQKTTEEIGDKDAQIQSLKKKMTNVMKINEALVDKNEDLVEENENLRETLVREINERQLDMLTNQDNVQRLEEEKSSLTKIVADLEQKSDELTVAQQQNTTMKQKIEELEGKMLRMAQESMDMQLRLRTMNFIQDELQNEILELEEQCTNLEEKVHEEEQKNLVMQEEIYHLKLELQEGNSHWLKSQKDLESVLEHNDQLKKELDQSQKMFASKIDNILREVVAKKGNIDNLEKENLELKQQSAACEEMLREKQEEITAMQTTIDGLMKEKKDLEQQFAACDEMLREKQEELTAMLTTINGLMKEKQELEQQFAACDEMLREKQEEITAMQTTIDGSMKEKQELEQQFAACEEMLREKQEELTAMQTTIDGLMKEKQDLEQQVKRASDESKISRTNLLKIRDDLYSQVEQQEEQIDLYKTRLNEMSETLVQLHISLLDHEDRVQYDGALRQVFRLMINRTRNLVPQQQLPNEDNPPVVAAPRAEENDHFPEAND